MKRIYSTLVLDHLKQHRQMVFLSGPRQVGKTTITFSLQDKNKFFRYLNWDDLNHRHSLLQGPQLLFDDLFQFVPLTRKPIIVLDEIHKYRQWKNYLKGFYDILSKETSIVVTGSPRLNIYKRGGDSLMGRYFHYRVHPFSVGELLRTQLPDEPIQPPKKISTADFKALFTFGGFPDPFIKQNIRNLNLWHNLRFEQLFKEEVRDLFQINELGQMELLAYALVQQAGGLVNYTELSKKIRVSDQTIRKWIFILKQLYYCFTIRPWSKNIGHSLLKQPKAFLWDWSVISDTDRRIENFLASQLLKWTHYLTDTGFGKFELFFIRDKQKNEVDFLVVKDHAPWILLEAKSSDGQISRSLQHFHKILQPQYCFQLIFEQPYIDVDFRTLQNKIKVIPMQTFLSQLM